MKQTQKNRRSIIWCAAFLLLLPVRPACSQKVSKLDPDSFYISLHLAVEPLLVDVRVAREYRKDRIPNAVSAPRSQELFRLTDGLDAEHPIYLYCNDESRSVQAAEMLLVKGFGNLTILKGGLREWKLRGLPVDISRKRR